MHGYSFCSSTCSSSSSSPDDPEPPPGASTEKAARKKIQRKRKPPPQVSINKIWKNFSSRNFAKALSILPFDPVPPPACPDRSNELVLAGYQRTVDECRRKVLKIKKEWRRVNMRYRDAGWDIVSGCSVRSSAGQHC